MVEFANPLGAHRDAGVPVQGRTYAGDRFVGENWTEMTFVECVFEGVAWDSVNLARTTFANCRFVDCAFRDCRVEGTQWVSSTGTVLRIAGGICYGPLLSECEFEEGHFEQAGMQVTVAQSRFGKLHFVGDGLEQDILTLSDVEIGALHAPGASWRDASVVGGDLRKWEVDGASFVRCSLLRATGEGVDLSRVSLDSCNLYQAQLPGAKFGAVDRTLFGECDLTGADFRDARAAGSLFAKVTAHGARFDRAVLSAALFPEADLSGASFEAAHAPASVWVGADCTDANLVRLSARNGTFRQAKFAGAAVGDADLRDTDLHGVEGDLSMADTRGSRGSIEWRAEREKMLQRLRDEGAGEDA